MGLFALSPFFLEAAPRLADRGEPVNLGKVGAGEGPAWSPKGELFFTGANRIMRRAADGSVHVFREPSGGANGLLFDGEGRLVTCEAGNRRVTRTEPDGTITVLADKFENQRFNSPNDLAIDSLGRIYFTDPRYGNRDTMETRDSGGKLVEAIYRIDSPGKVFRITTHEVNRPNGILVSPGDRYLFVADNNNNTAGGARKLWRFDLKSDGTVNTASRKLIFDWLDARGPDGFKMDRQGRLFIAAGVNKANQYETIDKFKGGVYVLNPDGKLLDFIAIPVDEVTNCAFGGADGKTLFITAGGTLWSVKIGK